MIKNTPKKILIADDEKPIAKALELKLNHVGFLAQSVGNGEEALALLSKEKFDLLLLDLVMPKMDGFTVLEEIKKKQLAVPVIVLSNLSQAEDEAKSRALGASGFFIKSNTPIADIVAQVQKFLGV
jgi:two-component system alkaline phosphatase synthesis response regulator PhoP